MFEPTRTTITDQFTAFRALDSLSAAHPALPAAYIVVYTDAKGFAVQLHDPASFEAWRDALGIETDAVELKAFRNDSWLQADIEYGGVTVHLTGFGIDVPADVTVKAAA